MAIGSADGKVVINLFKQYNLWKKKHILVQLWFHDCNIYFVLQSFEGLMNQIALL